MNKRLYGVYVNNKWHRDKRASCPDKAVNLAMRDLGIVYASSVAVCHINGKIVFFDVRIDGNGIVYGDVQ